MDENEFSGRVAWVTGGGGGIGGAVTAALLARGATVYCADIVSPPVPTGADPTRFRPVGLDVTKRAQVHRVLDEIVATAGRLDLLVNVAGVVSFGSAESLAEEEWDRVLDVNLKGTFLCCQAAIDPMRRNGYGRIVNVGSVVAKNGGNARPWLDPSEQERAGNVAYGVSKAGVHALTHFLSKELARAGVTVNAIAPGPIATGMTADFPSALRDLIPVGRMGRLDDVVRGVMFFASVDNGFVNGEVMDVNGGMWCD